LHSEPYDFNAIAEIAEKNQELELDLRPYMIEQPTLVNIYDKFSKVLNIFKLLQLRQLLVIDDKNGKLEGIITRQDLFSYMTL